jgi:acyl carrier protein
MARSPEISQAIFEDVKAVVVVTLGIEDQADDLGPETGLYGDLPELDSLTVVKLIVALQKRFGIEIKVDEIVGAVFDTLGRLAAFVESRVRWERGVEYHMPAAGGGAP